MLDDFDNPSDLRANKYNLCMFSFYMGTLLLMLCLFVWVQMHLQKQDGEGEL